MPLKGPFLISDFFRSQRRFLISAFSQTFPYKRRGACFEYYTISGFKGVSQVVRQTRGFCIPPRQVRRAVYRSKMAAPEKPERPRGNGSIPVRTYWSERKAALRKGLAARTGMCMKAVRPRHAVTPDFPCGRGCLSDSIIHPKTRRFIGQKKKHAPKGHTSRHLFTASFRSFSRA